MSAAPSDLAGIDPYDVSLALGAEPALRPYNEAGVLSAADVHVAQRLGELGEEPDPRVRLAAALAVRGVRGGSVCVDLAHVHRLDDSLDWPASEQWLAAVAASPLTGEGRPLRLEAGLLYLDRYWRQEVQVCADLLARDAQPPPEVDRAAVDAALTRLFPGGSADGQRRACSVAVERWTTVLGGGPGTGKTTTLAALLALLLDQPGPAPRVALAAPTGKAAARMQEAVHQAAESFTDRFTDLDRRRLGELSASTLHRLLGSRRGAGTRFRHNRGDKLPHDVVVVDETSMVSLTLMARLLEALRPDARLVLVGDPSQLASVEAGAVLADLVAGLQLRQRGAGSAPGVVLLEHNYRFGRGIGELAVAVRAGDADTALAVLTRGDPDVSFVPDALGEPAVRRDAVEAADALRARASTADAAGALALLDTHRVLCAHRSGPYGAEAWNRHVERWLGAELVARGERPEGAWYAGRPLLVTANDYGLGLFNGDTGVVVREAEGALRAVFARGSGLVRLAPSRLGDVQSVHAMTVHRSQGSQFARVTLVLPPQDSPLLTRELLYTALTRARGHVRVAGSEAAVRAAVERPAARASGLRERLAAG